MDKLLTPAECGELAIVVDERREYELDKLLEIEDPERRAIKREVGLFARLGEAYEWLCMMSACVQTTEACVKLEESVSVTLFDASLLPE